MRDDDRPRAQRRRRGFTLTELAAALAFFAIFATGVTVAAGSVVGSRQSARVARALDIELDALASRAVAVGYPAVATGAFTVPDACDGAPSGDAGESCVTVLGRPVRVAWDVSVEPGGAGERAGAGVTATASSSGITRSVTRQVFSDGPGLAAGEGQVALGVAQGAALAEGRTVYLLTGADEVAAQEVIGETGTVYLAAPATSCTAVAPCALSLSPDGPGLEADAAVLVGPAARRAVVLTEATSVPATGAVVAPGRLGVRFVARDALGVESEATALGSICVWATLTDDAGRQSVPVCNTATARGAESTGYDLGGGRLALAAGTEVEFSIDRPGGTCPAVAGTQVWSPTGWIAGTECSSWTWGTPVELVGPGSVAVPFEGARAVVGPTGSLEEYTVVFAGDGARPAAGYPGEPTWAKPRDGAACSADGSCLSRPTVPEPVACPGLHCFHTEVVP